MRLVVLAVLPLVVGCAAAPPREATSPTPPKDPAVAIVPSEKPKDAVLLPSATPEKHFETAQHAVAEGKYDEARTSLDRAIGLKPDWAEAYLLRGNVATLKREKGWESVAYADYDRAVTYRPELVDALIARAQASLALKDLDAAIADFDRAITVVPRRASLHYQKAMAHFAKNDDIKALACVNQAIVLDPEHVDAYRLRAQLDLFSKDYPKAIEDATRAIELSPADARAWEVRGKARMHVGDRENAKKDLESALRLDPLNDKLKATLQTLEREDK